MRRPSLVPRTGPGARGQLPPLAMFLSHCNIKKQLKRTYYVTQ